MSTATQAAPEKVRLLIWDLDDTFWSGTLTEGGISFDFRTIGIVKTLSERGIVNSVCSKNDPARARAELERAGVWNHFVFPRIAWEAKGAMVRSIVEASQLRPETVMFVDDNPINRNEVQHYNPGLQIAGPDFLDRLLTDRRFQGKNDRTLSRLKQYKTLEDKEVERAKFAENSTEFLRSSDIQISFHHDVMEQFDRVYELINRTNQLNFTKVRLPEDATAARVELQKLLTTEHDRHASYVKVSDKFGYYGIVGFCMTKAQILRHFTFSCRTLNMGIEQFVYARMRRPGIKVVGEVVSDLNTPRSVDWITVVDDAERRPSDRQPEQTVKICIRGACELAQASHYLQQRFEMIHEFPFPHRGWGINVPLLQYGAALERMTEPAHQQLLASFPGLHKSAFEGAVFSRSADVYVLSFMVESFVANYRYKPTGLIVPLMLGPGAAARDITTLDYKTIKSNTHGRGLVGGLVQAELRAGRRF